MTDIDNLIFLDGFKASTKVSDRVIAGLLDLLLDARPPKHGRMEWYEACRKAINDINIQAG